MNHLGTKTLETEHLILRKFQQDDYTNAFNNWMSDYKVTEFLRWKPHSSLKESEEIISSWILNYKNLQFYQWAIVLKNSNQPIGSMSVVEINEKTKKVHIGYCIGSKWWRLGYTSEALECIIKFFFEEVGIIRLESWHDPNNPNSGKVMKKCGLKYEGTLKKADWNNKGIVDACMYSIIDTDYFNN